MDNAVIKKRFETLSPHLDERLRRLLAAAEALLLLGEVESQPFQGRQVYAEKRFVLDVRNLKIKLFQVEFVNRARESSAPRIETSH